MSSVYVIALVLCTSTRIKWVCIQFTLLKLLFPLLGCAYYTSGYREWRLENFLACFGMPIQLQLENDSLKFGVCKERFFFFSFFFTIANMLLNTTMFIYLCLFNIFFGLSIKNSQLISMPKGCNGNAYRLLSTPAINNCSNVEDYVTQHCYQYSDRIQLINHEKTLTWFAQFP
jgi:hypothetical protein